MHTRFWFAVALAVAIAAATQAANIKKKADEDDSQPAVSKTETNEHALHSRDGAGANENNDGSPHGGDSDDEHADNGGKLGGSISAGKSDHEGGYKNDGGEKVEIIEIVENNDKKHGGYDEKEIVGTSSGDKDVKYIQVEPYGKKKKTVVYEKNEKNAYEKKEEPKSEYGKLHLSGLAEVIPAQHSALTLNQIYQVHKRKDDAYGGSLYNTPYGQHGYNNQQQILALLKFGRDFESWNPRNPNSQWEWFGTEGGAPADNAAYIVHHDKEGGYQKHSAYSPKKDSSYVVQYSLPYKKYYNSSDPNNDYTYFEGVVQTKNNFSIGPTERFLYRLKFSCKILNADRNPFPSQVSNPWNDPRLGTCGFSITDSDPSLLFAIQATNTGVWAQYGRRDFQNETAQPFITERLVGRRPRYDTVVDGAIEIDRREGKVNYYLNGYLVWTIYAIGVLPPNDRITVINRGQGEPQIKSISSVRVNFGTYKGLDRRDPNNRYNKQRLVRVQGNSTYYSANDTFYDENNLKRNQLWGQGAIMTLLKLIVLKAESFILPQQILPGVYGAEHPKYQKASPYED